MKINVKTSTASYAYELKEKERVMASRWAMVVAKRYVPNVNHTHCVFKQNMYE